MEYRGVKYTVVQGTLPGVWKWSMLVGRPKMLRLGEAATQVMAETQVQTIIDPAISLEEILSSQQKPPDGTT
jgi:hypothetical protein